MMATAGGRPCSHSKRCAPVARTSCNSRGDTACAQDAVLRNFTVIGEAVKNLSQSFRDAHPDVPWREVAGMRDILIHQYFRINLDTVWSVVESKLPDLLTKVEAMLAELPADPDEP